MLPRIKARWLQVWSWYRQIAAVRGLLQWTGWWETVAATTTSIALAWGSFVEGVAWPIRVLIALTGFVLVSALWRIRKSPSNSQSAASKPEPPTSGDLALGFFQNDSRSIRIANGVPREYRVKVVNRNATTHGVRVALEGATPPIRNLAGVNLRPHNSAAGADGTITLGPSEPAYFNLMEYNPMDIAEGKSVMHITHTVGTAPVSVPVEDYEFTVRTYSEECQSAPIRVKFQRTYGPYSRMHQVDVRTEASDDDPQVSASYREEACGDGIAVVNNSDKADACKVTISEFDFEGVALRSQAIELLPRRGTPQILDVRALRVSDGQDIGDITSILKHFCLSGQLTIFLSYRDAWGRSTFERPMTFSETAWLETGPDWPNELPTVKLGDIIKRPLV